MTQHSTSLLPENLFLRLSTDALCMARYDAEVHTAFAYSTFRLNPQISLTANLREAIRKEDLLKNVGDGCVQVAINAPATFVPLAEFQEEDCVAIYDHCFPSDKKRRVFYDIVASANCVVLFSLLETTCRALEETFGDIHYISTLTPLIRHCVTKGNNRIGQKRIFVTPHGGSTDILVFEDNRLLMANTYTVSSAVDVAYFAFNVARQLGAEFAPTDNCDPEEGYNAEHFVPFYISGSDNERQAVCEELQKYAANVLCVSPGAEFNRHIVATTPDVPYDLITWLLG